MAKTKMKKDNEVRKSCVCFSLSPDEKAVVAEKAERVGLTMSAYIRYKLFYEPKEGEL